MRRSIVKLILYLIAAFTLVLFIVIMNNLMGRENVIERISELPDLEMSTLDGKLVNMNSVLNDKPLILYYFNTNCIFCQGTFVDLPNHPNLLDEATILFISDEHPDTLKKFISELGFEEVIKLHFLNDREKLVKDFYSIRAVPAIYLYDRDGKLIQFYRGAVGLVEIGSRLYISDSTN